MRRPDLNRYSNLGPPGDGAVAGAAVVDPRRGASSYPRPPADGTLTLIPSLTPPVDGAVAGAAVDQHHIEVVARGERAHDVREDAVPK